MRGDYMTFRLNGLKYFEKRPLLYWIQTIPKLFSIREGVMRLTVAFFDLLGCLMVYFFVSTVGSDEETIRTYIENQEKVDQEQVRKLSLNLPAWATALSDSFKSPTLLKIMSIGFQQY